MTRPYGNGEATRASIDERRNMILLRTRVGKLEGLVQKLRDENDHLRARLEAYMVRRTDRVEDRPNESR